ncbi:hypothetical protein [Candidatus Uabimicrobium amorphum]|uniref:Uncharacterized protein n=1 Tax=Uabimicrobium amorphum TaxID=2596890 RepID=A0A5S9F3J1_UABAM|nr:hypothetical protein [Candidatus Uabimicrobium amorphum]BBM84542.1 hypothetical protein UABAM_02903 [Candidatus Uabimicrobium amorphum]
MRIVKQKTLHAVEPRTEYRGCTFYLEGPHCLDDCVFDNCSFRGEMHYVESEESQRYPEFRNCNFNCKEVSMKSIGVDELIAEVETIDIEKIITKLIVVPFSETQDKLKIERDLLKIKTIDLSAYESYNEIPVEWFERFPTLERVILPLSTDLVICFQEIPLKKRIKFNISRVNNGYKLTRLKKID